MKRKVMITLMSASIGLCVASCAKEKGTTDRRQATDLYERICALTKEYTDRLESAPDSADWAELCTEFEDKLDKVSFSFPPDTDLLLTEGQNDTIHALMQEYVRVRSERIHGILHPEPAIDSTSVADSLQALEATQEGAVAVSSSKEDASRSPGN